MWLICFCFCVSQLAFFEFQGLFSTGKVYSVEGLMKMNNIKTVKAATLKGIKKGSKLVSLTVKLSDVPKGQNFEKDALEIDLENIVNAIINSTVTGLEETTMCLIQIFKLRVAVRGNLQSEQKVLVTKVTLDLIHFLISKSFTSRRLLVTVLDLITDVLCYNSTDLIRFHSEYLFKIVMALSTIDGEVPDKLYVRMRTVYALMASKLMEKEPEKVIKFLKDSKREPNNATFGIASSEVLCALNED